MHFHLLSFFLALQYNTKQLILQVNSVVLINILSFILKVRGFQLSSSPPQIPFSKGGFTPLEILHF